MIFRIQPYVTNKADFGAVLNAHCAAAPADSWIQLMDWDAHILCRESYDIIDKAIARYPDTDIFGAVTNRVGVSYQRVFKEQCEEWNYKAHVKTANHYATLFKEGECANVALVAGFFMLFKKSYWQANPFPPTIMDARGKSFDKIFCAGAKTIRIIEGLYVFHQYRMLQEDWRNNKHLF